MTVLSWYFLSWYRQCKVKMSLTWLLPGHSAHRPSSLLECPHGVLAPASRCHEDAWKIVVLPLQFSYDDWFFLNCNLFFRYSLQKVFQLHLTCPRKDWLEVCLTQLFPQSQEQVQSLVRMHHKRREETAYSNRSNFVAVVGGPFQGECVRWVHFFILDPNIMNPAGYADLHNPRHGMW